MVIHWERQMPFTPYNSVLDPEMMKTAQEAFDLAWSEIITGLGSPDAAAARELLAKKIIEAAVENGERDPERLKAYALVGYKSRQSA